MSGCNASLNNTRGDKCPSIMDITRRFMFVPELDDAGAKNEIANVAGVTKAALQAKFDAGNYKDRYYPTSQLENVEDLRGEAILFTFNSGNQAKIKDGDRNFVGFFPYQGPEYLGKLKAWGCSKFGVHPIDDSGGFIYATDSATKLKVQPIMVDESSFSAELIKKTDTDPAMIKISFNFRKTEQDELLRVIGAADLDFDGLSIVDVYGLYDAKHTVASISTTGFVSTITENIYGFAIEGLIAGDFSAYNDTDSAAVTISSVTEGGAGLEGVYTFVIVAETSADSLTLSLNKAGYDDVLIQAVKIVIP